MEKKNLLTGALAALAIVFLVLSIFAFTSRISKDDNAAQIKAAEDAKEKEAEAQLDALKTQLDAKMADLNTKIAELQTQVNAKTAQIADLQTTAATNADAASKVATLEAEKAALQKELDSTAKSLESLKDLGKVFEVQLGAVIPTTTLDDRTVTKLLDTTVDFDDSAYDVVETFKVAGLAVKTSFYDEDFGAKPYLISEGVLTYTYTFEEGIKPTSETPLEFKFLGKDMTIVDVETDGVPSIKIQDGDKVFLNIGDTKAINEKDLRLLGVSETKAVFTYNGATESVTIGGSKKVGGLLVKVVDAVNYDNGNGFANIVVGTDAARTLENGEDFYKDNDNYIFDMTTYPDDSIKTLSVYYDVKSTDLEDDVPPVTVGGKINFADYLSVEFAQLTNTDYINAEVSYGSLHKRSALDHDVYVDSEKVLIIKSADKSIEVNTDVEVSTIYVVTDTALKGIYFINEDGYAEKTVSPKIVNDDFDLLVSYVGPTLKLDNLDFTTDFVDEDFSGIYTSYDNDVLTLKGIVLYDVENNAENGKIKLSIPQDIVEANILVR